MSDATSLGEALLAVQRAMPAIQKDAINPHYRSGYIKLETLMPPVLGALNENGVVLTQFPTGIDTGSGVLPALRTRLTHAASGEFMEDAMLLMSAKDDPQGQGSALTYARRYALMAILGLVADEDDDGEKATKSAAGASRPQGSQEPSTAPPPSPAAAAQAAYEASRVVPEDDGNPANVEVHFGKNKGIALGSLTEKQRAWYANTWDPDSDPKYPAKPEDRRLKLAAQILMSGGGEVDFQRAIADEELPF